MGGVYRVRRVRKEVAADRKEYLDLPLEHCMQSLNRVVSPFLRRIEVELLRQRIQKRLRRALPDAHRAVALHIRMPPKKNRSRSWPAEIAANQQQVHDHRNVIHAVLLLRHAQAPSADRLL